MAELVCAVVVTFNRKDLLRECLVALLAQTRKVDEILVVDNASTDGTREFLAQEFPQVPVLNLPKNIGGAGGFHEGMKWAYNKGFDWIWVMDDDTVTTPTALSELFAARDRFLHAARQPSLLASKVIWVDGTLHTMNIPSVKRSFDDPESLFIAAEKSTLSLRTATFVSLLMQRRVIKQYGLPLTDYFIWDDDTEYTARILRHNFGVLVPSSVVLHKTIKKHTAVDATPQRYYYHVRNVLWMLTRSKAWSFREKIAIFMGHAHVTWQYLNRSRFSWVSVRAVCVGIWDGIFTSPKPVAI